MNEVLKQATVNEGGGGSGIQTAVHLMLKDMSVDGHEGSCVLLAPECLGEVEGT